MSTFANDWDPKGLWAPYAPGDEAPWDLRRVVHLHRRAGFAATCNEKVNDVPAMKRQNEIFRQLGRGPFGELLKAVVHDPALLIWLDAPANRKGQPNENLGRELMELFTLGVGHYTETDVKEAARALTGWKVALGAFRAWAPDHDDGEKTI